VSAAALDLELLREAHGGFCVARSEGKVVFVRGGIPGERVLARVTQENAHHSIADVVEVVTPSPDRVAHIWPEAGRAGVGGVDLGHVAPDAQRRWKGNVIGDVVRRIGGERLAEELGPVEVRAVGEYATGTRTRVSFVADDKGRLAMRRPRSHETVAVHDMPLAVPEFARLGLFEDAWLWAPGETVAAVVPSASPPVVVTGDAVRSAPGRAALRRVREEVRHGGHLLRYVVDAAGFWQVHRDAPRVLVERVLGDAALTGGESVLELYAGAGLLTAPLADAVGPTGAVVSVEGSVTAVDDANVNLAGRPQVRAWAGTVDVRAVGDGPVDVVVLDPPRTGAGTVVMRAILARGPGRIVYVACDPAALARDLAECLGEYRVEHVEAFDLFPHTHHVETVVCLARR